MDLLSKNLSANLLSNVWSIVLLLFLTPLYISLLGVESYGLIGFYLSWVTILGILDMGISVTAMREIAWRMARPDEKKSVPTLLRSLEVTYWVIILILGMGIMMFAWFFGAEWFQTKNLQPELIRNTLLLMAVSLILQVPSGLYIGGLMGMQRQVECSGLLALFGTVRGLGALFLLWLVSNDIQTFFLWQIFVSFLQTTIMRDLLYRRLHIKGVSVKFSKDMLLLIKGYAGKVIFIGVLGIIMAQTDKLLLSRLSSMEDFGFYMLAWAVASGLTRVSTPLMQAFSPRFTELISKGDEKGVAIQVRIASQLMSALIIPPIALITVLSKPILYIWLGNETTAESTAQILQILILGTMFASCSYPPVSILYSRKKLMPVVLVNLFCAIILIPILVVAIIYYSSLGAAYMWCFYCVTLYLAHHIIGLRGLPETRFISSVSNNFIAPCLTSFLIAVIFGYWLNRIDENITFVCILIFALLIGWLAAILVCKDLREIFLEKLECMTTH